MLGSLNYQFIGAHRVHYLRISIGTLMFLRLRVLGDVLTCMFLVKITNNKHPVWIILAQQRRYHTASGHVQYLGRHCWKRQSILYGLVLRCRWDSKWYFWLYTQYLICVRLALPQRLVSLRRWKILQEIVTETVTSCASLPLVSCRRASPMMSHDLRGPGAVQPRALRSPVPALPDAPVMSPLWAEETLCVSGTGRRGNRAWK